MLLKIVILALCVALGIAKTKLPNIVQPCGLQDHKCIRDNFWMNSKCNKRVRGSAPAIFNVPQARFETPFFNASYIDNNLIIRGLDRCYISEFFFNRKADGGVLGINCPDLNFESDRVMFQHHSLREDDVYRYHINGTYPLIRLTTTLARADKLDLCQEFTYPDVTALPIFHIDPRDKQTANFLTRDLTLLNIYEREMFLYRAKMLVRRYVNNVICDFGCY